MRGDETATRQLGDKHRHTAQLMPALQAVLKAIGARPGDVDRLCFSQGPGSFTGLRVAATVARMWQSATGCKVYGIPSLEVLAFNARTYQKATHWIVPLVNARGGRVFTAVYKMNIQGFFRTVREPVLTNLASWLPTLERPCRVLGDAAKTHAAELAATGLDVITEEAACYPTAEGLLQVAFARFANDAALAPHEIVPHYLRPPECEEVYEKRRAAAMRKKVSG